MRLDDAHLALLELLAANPAGFPPDALACTQCDYHASPRGTRAEQWRAVLFALDALTIDLVIGECGERRLVLSDVGRAELREARCGRAAA